MNNNKLTHGYLCNSPIGFHYIILSFVPHLSIIKIISKLPKNNVCIFHQLPITQISPSLPINVIVFYIISIIHKQTKSNDFQLALLSHLHPAFENLVFPKLTKNCLALKSSNITIKTGLATCTLCLQFNFHLIYFHLT